MAFKLYRIRLKCLLRNKENMFWCYLFPILLATCFFFAFNNLITVRDFKTINIAYISSETENDLLKTAISQARLTDKTPLFSMRQTDQEEARVLLEEKEIEAYIVGGSEPVLYVRKNGLNETIIKAFLDSQLRIAYAVETILINNPEAINQGLIADLIQTDTYVYEYQRDKKPDVILVFFYALLAYTCIFAAYWGMEEVINIQADLSHRGARINMAPIRKMKLFVINILAALTAHFGSVILLLFYMYFIIKVDFGGSAYHTALTCLAGSMAGISLGAAVGMWVKQKAEIKEAILTSFIMVGAFLSGMMYVDMKLIIATRFPIIAKINPVNLVADSFYSLYYFDTLDRFYSNILILCIMTLVLGAISYIGLRRKTYASI